jgi:hypothetical protein
MPIVFFQILFIPLKTSKRRRDKNSRMLKYHILKYFLPFDTEVFRTIEILINPASCFIQKRLEVFTIFIHPFPETEMVK